MGDSRVLKPAAVVVKKKPRRPRDRDATGIGCVLPKAGKRRDGARGSGANVPDPLTRLSLSHSLSLSRFLSIPGDFPSPGRLAPKTGPPRAFPATAPTPTFHRRHPPALITSFTVERNEHGGFVKRSAELARTGIN